MTGNLLKVALAAALIAIIGGIFGAVPLLTLLVRSLLLSLFAVGLAAGAYWVIKKYLPELLTMAGKLSSADDGLDASLGGDLSSGGMVDIVLDDQPDDDQALELRRAMRPSSRSGAPVAQDDFAEDDDLGSGVSDDGPVRNIFMDEGDDSLIEEVQEDGEMIYTQNKTGSSGSMQISDDDIDSLDTDVGSLPDIGSLADTFNDGIFSDGEDPPEGEEMTDSDYAESLSVSSGRRSSGAGNSSSGVDPQLMAAAIRTAMKKQA